MTLKIAPTDIISAEILFKDYVTFKDNKVYLTEDVPEHIADFFKEIMPDFVLIIYEMLILFVHIVELNYIDTR